MAPFCIEKMAQTQKTRRFQSGRGKRRREAMQATKRSRGSKSIDP
jgi:hypothetical protein